MKASHLLLPLVLAWSGPSAAEILYRAQDSAGQVVHVLTQVVKPAGVNWGPSPALLAALDGARVLLLQTDTAPAAAGAQADAFAKVAIFPAGERLESHLGRARWNRLEKTLSAQGLDADNLQQDFRPFLASQILAAQQYLAAGIDLASQVNDTLIARAKVAGKRVGGLQDRFEAAAPWSAMPSEAQVQLLQWQAERGVGLANDIKAGWKLWVAGDAAGYGERVAARLADYRAMDPELPARLFAQRRGWLQQISASAAESPLIVVNALDVLGPGGLLEGLEVAGFKVQQVLTTQEALRGT